uniref:Serpin domain-containing protein n=1 Tax=Timema poppense TaxID=170557 RepID=A0A7R9CTF5_TIMPO|nr:unnamed protein product [Timema poppensis]
MFKTIFGRLHASDGKEASERQVLLSEFERTTFVWAALCEAWRKLFNRAKKCVAIVILHVRVNLPLLLPRLRGTDHGEERLKPVIQIDESSTLQICGGLRMEHLDADLGGHVIRQTAMNSSYSRCNSKHKHQWKKTSILSPTDFQHFLYAAYQGSEYNGSITASNYRFTLKLINRLAIDTTAVTSETFPSTRSRQEYEICKKDKGKNTLLAVASLSQELSILYEAASTSSRQEMFQVLQFPETNREIYKSVFENMKNQFVSSKLRSGVRLFVDRKVRLENNFNETMVNYFNAKVELLNFKYPEAVATRINSWVDQLTHRIIHTIVDKGETQEQGECGCNEIAKKCVWKTHIDRLSNEWVLKECSLKDDIQSDAPSLILATAMYFKGKWKLPFLQEATSNEPFSVSPQETIEVPTMYVVGDFQIRESSQLRTTFVKIPYQDPRLYMIVALPDKDIPLDGVLEAMKVWPSNESMNDFETRSMEILLPRFVVESSIELVPILKESSPPLAVLQEEHCTPVFQTGLKLLFSTGSELTNMSPDGDLTIGSVRQKTRLEVNEEGSTAGVAAAGSFSWKIANELFRLKVDRPFLFVILGEGYQVPLFLGRVVRPQ